MRGNIDSVIPGIIIAVQETAVYPVTSNAIFVYPAPVVTKTYYNTGGAREDDF